MSNTREACDSSVIETPEIKDPWVAVEAITGWVLVAVDVIKHFRKIPEGTVLRDDSGIEHTLSGDYLSGFRAGLDLAILEFSELPFKVSEVSIPDAAGH